MPSAASIHHDQEDMLGRNTSPRKVVEPSVGDDIQQNQVGIKKAEATNFDYEFDIEMNSSSVTVQDRK